MLESARCFAEDQEFSQVPDSEDRIRQAQETIERLEKEAALQPMRIMRHEQRLMEHEDFRSRLLPEVVKTTQGVSLAGPVP